MLTCIARSKRPGDESSGQPDDPDSKHAKSLTSQLKDMALKASGAYRHCTPCTEGQVQAPIKSTSVTIKSDFESDHRFKMLYGRSNSSITSTAAAAATATQQQQPRVWGKEMEARLKGISSGEATPKSASGRNRVDPIVFVEEKEPKEWVAQVEPGVLITFVSLPGGCNDLKRIRFGRDMFNKLQAQKWWADNYDKVMELYNVQKLSRQAFPLPTPPRSQNEKAKVEYHPEDTPATPPLNKERLPRKIHRPAGLAACSSSDSLESGLLNSTPKLSSLSGAKTETSSITSSSSRDADRSEEMSVSNASDVDQNEWVEQDEPGVYITIKVLPCGKRELRRVRFSREVFGEMHARVWWEENRARIHEQYL